MRTVAAYSLTQAHPDSKQALEGFNTCCFKAEDWLRWKGAKDVSIGQREVNFPDGRVAQLTREYTETDHGALASFILNEPVDGGQFETHLSIASSGEGLVFLCHLRTESKEAALVPIPFEVRCPRVVREIVQIGEWTSGSSPASGKHLSSVGRDEGKQLISDIWDLGRGLPVVMVSQLEGRPLRANISQDLAYDLVGLAIVVEIDDETSWLLSEIKGREWSCYGGAVRLYWPFQGTPDDPYRHPLWTQTKLYRGGVDSGTATRRVQNRLHRLVFGQSTFQPEPPLIVQIRDEYFTEQRRQARDAEDYYRLASSYELENRSLKQSLENNEEHIKELQEQIEDLRAQNRELTISQLWADGTAEDASTEPDEAIWTNEDAVVEDVVTHAKAVSQNLTFGADVERGISGLAPQAGPPRKIFRYLRELDTMTLKLNEGTLGIALYHWLNKRGVSVSGESETTGNSTAQTAKRTWDNGSGNRRIFYNHLKPSESTSPDRCVRIYFEYDKPSGKTIVGWIGRHPE